MAYENNYICLFLICICLLLLSIVIDNNHPTVALELDCVDSVKSQI